MAFWIDPKNTFWGSALVCMYITDSTGLGAIMKVNLVAQISKLVKKINT